MPVLSYRLNTQNGRNLFNIFQDIVMEALEIGSLLIATIRYTIQSIWNTETVKILPMDPKYSNGNINII